MPPRIKFIELLQRKFRT